MEDEPGNYVQALRLAEVKKRFLPEQGDQEAPESGGWRYLHSGLPQNAAARLEV